MLAYLGKSSKDMNKERLGATGSLEKWKLNKQMMAEPADHSEGEQTSTISILIMRTFLIEQLQNVLLHRRFEFHWQHHPTCKNDESDYHA